MHAKANQEQSLLAQVLQLVTTPCQKGRGHFTHRGAVNKAQPYLLSGRSLDRPPAHQKSVARKGLWVRVIFGDRLFHQTQGLTRTGPSMQVRRVQPVPPGLIFESQSPIGMLVSQANQPVPSPLSLAYAGSGLVIHCLARCQRTPRRAKVARVVSPVTLFALNPCSKLTSAANSRGHKPVCLPKARGLWCSRAPNPLSRSPLKTARIVWGVRSLFSDKPSQTH